MKKRLVLFLGLFILVSMNFCFADVELSNESKYGLALDFGTNSDYPGEIIIDGVFIHEDASDYIVSVLYSQGNLVTIKNNGILGVKTSFFNPSSGDLIEISWLHDFDRTSYEEGLVQYTVDKAALMKVDTITIFLYDTEYNNSDQNISVYLDMQRQKSKFIGMPMAESLVKGYEIQNHEIEDQFDETVSEWAKKNIEELSLENIFRDDAFALFQKGITRERFVYLMVGVYEELTGDAIVVDPTLSFSDTKDLNVLKAATLGITRGLGQGVFGPEQVIDREQMVTFLVRTLRLAGIDLSSWDGTGLFSDDDQISDWAREAVYAAKSNQIIDGVGKNRFEPKTAASNQEGLFVSHKLLSNYGDLAWYQEFDGERAYLQLDDELYQIGFEKNIIIGDNNELYFQSYKDINDFLNLALLKSYHLRYADSPNPNVKGKLEIHDYHQMKVSAESLYQGVDKVGEKTKLDFKNGTYQAEVSCYNSGETAYKNFTRINYYTMESERNHIETIAIEELCRGLGIEYHLTYHPEWDIYVFEFEK